MVNRERVFLTEDDRRSLARYISGSKTSTRQLIRARIILMLGDGVTMRETARALGVSVPTVGLWRDRFEAEGIAGLTDRTRRPRRLSEDAAVKGPSELEFERLLEAALTTLGKRGFCATRISDIAQEAGVSTATIHYYFETRQEALFRAMLYANDKMIKKYGQSAESHDALEKLISFIDRSMPYAGDQQDEYRLEIDLWSHARVHPELLPAWEQYQDWWVARLVDIIESGVVGGVFTLREEVGDVAERIVGLTDGLAMQAATGARRMPVARVREIVTAFVSEQVGVPKEKLLNGEERPKRTAS